VPNILSPAQPQRIKRRNRLDGRHIILKLGGDGEHLLRIADQVKRNNILLYGIAAMALASCSVGPDYQRPPLAVPVAWKGDARATPDWPGEEWWHDFGAKDLERLIAQARQANYDIAVALARLKQANAQARIAGGPLLPSVDFTADGQRIRQHPSYKNGTNVYNAGLIASYQLDLWGAVADQVAAAQLIAHASRFDLETAELTLQSAVANNFFTLLSLNERISLAQDDIAAAVGVAEAYQARLDVGTASELDLAQQQNIVDEQRAALPPLIEQRRQTQDALAVLVGSLPEAVDLPEGSLEDIRLPGVVAGLPSGLLARRPDVQSAEANLQAANQTVKAATAALFPTISLTAQGGAASETLTNLWKPDGVFYALGGSLSQPIFHSGALQGGIDLASGRYEEQLAVYRKTVLSAFADVEDALAAVEMETKREQADAAAVTTARKAYQISQAQLYNGTIDILTVLNTQRILFQSQDQLAQARLTRAQAMVSLFVALGGGWHHALEG
jgi:NodT family efflux transporter outer membrane factor (OMF) lipoprotein